MLGDNSSFLLPYLVIIKILRGKSSLASLFIALNNDVVAILYKILDIGSRSHFRRLYFLQNSSVVILPYCFTLYTSLGLTISKILRGKRSLPFLLPPHFGDIIALLYKKLDIGSRSSFSKDLIKNLAP